MIDVIGVENYMMIFVIVLSLLDKNVIWVGMDDGNL